MTTSDPVREIYLEAVQKIYPYANGRWIESPTDELRRILMDVSDRTCQTPEARIARYAMKSAAYARLEKS